MKTEYDKLRHLKVQLDKANEEIAFLRRELELCKEMTMKKSQK